MMILIALLFLINLGHSAGLPAEYELLKKFRETKDIGTGLFLLDNYSDAVFIDELRIELAEVLIQSGERALARKVLSKTDLGKIRYEYAQKAVDMWLDLSLDPYPLLINFPEKVPHLLKRYRLNKEDRERVLSRLIRHRHLDAVLSYREAGCYYRGLALYRKKKYTRAIKVFNKCPDKRAGTYGVLSYLRLGNVTGAVRFVRKRKDEDLYFLLGKGFLSAGKLKKARRFIQRSGFNLRRFFYEGLITYAQGRYRQSYELFSRSLKYAKTDREKAKVHFWIFKSLMKIGAYDLALDHLKKARTDNSFYSVVARFYLRDEIELPPNYVVAHNPSSELYERLKSIKLAGFDHYFRLEVLKNLERLSREDLILLRNLDPYIAIKAGIRLYGSDSDIVYFLLYATPFEEVVEEASRKFGIEKALIYAVMKQESLFNDRAVSRSMAKGVMQLLDRTARWKARRIGYEISNIFDPRDNIMLGTAYLRFLLDLWNGDLVKALASYNAGQGAVSRWRDYSDSYLYIELIPYNETRNYVKKVLRNYYIYRLLLR